MSYIRPGEVQAWAGSVASDDVPPSMQKSLQGGKGCRIVGGMVNTEAQEFFFVEELPKREKSRWQKVWEHFEETKRLTEQHGLLVPLNLAAAVAGVSRQRITELCEAKTLGCVEVNGHPFITESTLVPWAKSERKAGRPFKLAGSKKQAFAAAMDYAKAESKGRAKKTSR